MLLDGSAPGAQGGPLRERLLAEAASADEVRVGRELQLLPPEAALRCLQQVRRVLRPGGRVLVTVDDLEREVGRYLERRRDGARRRAQHLGAVDTACALVNDSFRGVGDGHLYDAEELSRPLERAGFASPQLVDTSPVGDGALVVEATADGVGDRPVRGLES
ncbi:class I SAM-dependent methyltransferase [Kineococcus arenarius]|uniref:hypothetical protein n=1 Tax=unclassified Kineococcus TaxID=2621656 RepID=UPI003D7DC203